MARRSRRRYEQEYDEYMGDVKDYLNKVDRGRSTRKILPDDPAVSQETETLRQNQKLKNSNEFFGRYDRMTQDVKRTKNPY